MNILIIGLGFLGYPLAQRCLAQNWQVRAVKKNPIPANDALPIKIDVCTLHASCFQAAWAAYDQWVIILPPSALSDYAATLETLIAFAEQLGVSHLVYTSSTSVFGRANGTFDEHSTTLPETDSAKSMIAIEQRLLASSITHIDILRLGGLYAAERHPLTSLLAKPQPHNNGQQWVNMLHRNHAVAGVMRALQTPNGKRLRHLVETPHLTKQQFYHQQAALLGLPQLSFMTDTTKAEQGKRIITAYADWRIAVFGK